MTNIAEELCDTYGGNYTYKYVGYEYDESGILFYEWYLGAREHDWGSKPMLVDDKEDIAYYITLTMEG